MKLSDWAKRNEMTYKSALRMFHAGTLPVHAVQLANKTIIVMPPSYSVAMDAVRRLPRDDQVRLAKEVLEEDC